MDGWMVTPTGGETEGCKDRKLHHKHTYIYFL